MSTRTIDKIKKGLGIILTVALIASVAGVGFGSRRMEAPDIEQANLPTFDGSTYRRPAPNVTIDATDVIRVGASGTTTMGPGNSIKKATQSGIPEITAGSFQSQALAGETAYWPTITFASDKAVNITGVTLSGTGVSASVTHTGGNLNNTQSATWQIQGGTATAGNLLKADIKYTYTWNNTYTGASVTDEYVTTAYSYVENIIFPAGGWVWAAAGGSDANNAADTNYISRIIGRGVYGGLQQLSSSSGDYRSGYIDLAHSDQFVVVTDANFTRSTLRIDPPRQGAGDRELANGTSAYTSGDQHRGKAIIYRDSGLSSLKDNNVRMHFLIHKDIRAGVDLTWETVHLRSGDATYKGSTGNDLGTSHAGSWTALAPTGPKDGTVSSGGTWGGFKTTGMQITSYFEGSGAAGTYTLINQWTGKGKSEGTPSATNWIQHYLAQLIEVITYNKNNLRSKLNTQIGITNKTVTGAKNVTTIVTTNGSDPTSGGISNTNKGKNPQAWYYSAGWSTWKSTYETGWLQMQKPNTSQASIDSAVNAMDSPYAGLTLARANYSNSTNQNLGSGQGNTYYGSSVKPIDTTLSAINNADTNFNAKLKFWKTGTYNYYTASSKSALEAAIADAQAVQAANYNVLYQPYVDLAAKELHDAINNLAYAEYNLTYNANFSGGPTQSVLVEAGSTINLPATAPFSRTGYTFNNWNTAANASGTSYTSGAQFTMGGVDTSLYAQWTPHTYKVTYDGNGSDGGTAMAQSSHTYDVSKALSKNTYTRTGYAFMGWATSTNGSVAYQDEQSVSNLTATNNGNVTLYAVWVAQQYEVQYLGNGSDGGSMTNSFHTVGVSKKLSKNNYTRTGYNFNGWNDAADGTGTHYNDEETVVNLALVGNVTVPLYAQWEIKSYTISWLANGGTGGGANQAEHGSTPTPISAGTRTGYTFTEWSPEIIPATGPASYTAQWQANTYYVAFDANTGTGSMTNQEFTYNAAQNLKANAFSKTGYTFAGWATSAGGDVVYTAGQNVNNLATSQGAVVTLYAKWSPNSYTVQYDANSGTGTTGTSSHIYDTPSGLTENGFSKVGHSFIGWSTDSGATSPTYTDGQSVNNLTSNPGGIVNFYAVWQINQYKVYFDKNEAIGTGATGSHGPLTQNYDSDVTLPTTGFSAPGRTLLGWHTN
ncbi:MAG: InlB B-repeat-containing protein, partial [Clostridiales bacterium]|nr:InlB B-repeat-containing protein [Clostridiales bacterium]